MKTVQYQIIASEKGDVENPFTIDIGLLVSRTAKTTKAKFFPTSDPVRPGSHIVVSSSSVLHNRMKTLQPLIPPLVPKTGRRSGNRGRRVRQMRREEEEAMLMQIAEKIDFLEKYTTAFDAPPVEEIRPVAAAVALSAADGDSSVDQWDRNTNLADDSSVDLTSYFSQTSSLRSHGTKAKRRRKKRAKLKAMAAKITTCSWPRAARGAQRSMERPRPPASKRVQSSWKGQKSRKTRASAKAQADSGDTDEEDEAGDDIAPLVTDARNLIMKRRSTVQTKVKRRRVSVMIERQENLTTQRTFFEAWHNYAAEQGAEKRKRIEEDKQLLKRREKMISSLTVEQILYEVVLTEWRMYCEKVKRQRHEEQKQRQQPGDQSVGDDHTHSQGTISIESQRSGPMFPSLVARK